MSLSSCANRVLHSRARQCLYRARSVSKAGHHYFCAVSRAVPLPPCSAALRPPACSSRPLPTTAASSTTRATPLGLSPPFAACRTFTTACQGTPSDGTRDRHLLTHIIPYQSTLKDGRHVEVDFFRHSSTDLEEDEWFAGMALMNLVIREGKSWPFEEEFASVETWRGYFLSHTAFVVRSLDNGMDAEKGNSSSQGEVLGCFYIKPNFPGRCSHVCNGGFISAPRFRGLGIGRLMGRVFLGTARDLGYKSCYFNLVFKSNVGSVKLWESLGFQRVATLEKAAKLEGLEEGELDTAYGYHFDLDQLPADYLGVDPAA